MIFRIEPITLGESFTTYYEIQVWRGNQWIPVMRNGVFLRFKLEKMAVYEKESLEKFYAKQKSIE